MKTPILVIGAGPAGMMAALRAAACGATVILIEQNPTPGKKLLLTGKGRCNLTNACDQDAFMARFGRNGAFLRDAFKTCFNDELCAFFTSRGLALKTERQGRVFPVTDRSESVLDVLHKALQRAHVTLRVRTRVKSLVISNGRVSAVRCTGGEEITAQAVIMATGGASYRATGSTGEGIEIARTIGHRISPLRAALVPLVTYEKAPKHLEGLALKNIRLTFSDGKKKIITDIGELMFTFFGVSGPLVLSKSADIVDWIMAEKHVTASIDLKPGMSAKQLDERFLRDFKARPRTTIKTLLKEFLPQRMIVLILKRVAIDPDKQVSHITATERRCLGKEFKAFTLRISGSLGTEEGMVTRGGVSLKDIDPRTMASRLVNGLYFAGEMIDLDGDTGGFNLQAAFSTGWLAGESSSKTLPTR